MDVRTLRIMGSFANRMLPLVVVQQSPVRRFQGPEGQEKKHQRPCAYAPI